jgi:DNA-binding LytR/AlgR family response regulator
LILLTLRTLLIDDEQVARKVLREELKSLEQIEVIGEAENGQAALSAIRQQLPDLIFLDIQMPGMSGFDLLQQMTGGHIPAVIMVTAYDQYAIQAFEEGAIDYLLKPVRRERLVQAVERASRLTQDPLAAAEKIVQLQQELAPTPRKGERHIRKIVGRSGEEYFLLSPEEILAFQASGDLVKIITGNQSYLATQNLKKIAERLEDSEFRRIHRNALVNINQIRKLSMLSSQRWLVTLNNGQEFTVSKRQAKNIRDVMDW